MKIQINVPYRNGCWMVVGCLLMMAFMVPLTVTLMAKEEYGSALVCAFFALVLLRGAWVRFNYGLRINEKRIVLRSHRQKRVIPYDAVRGIVVTFHQASVAVRVITQDAEEIHFVWEEMMVESKRIFPTWGWGSGSTPARVGIRMTERFVEKSMERLSQCEKVRVENFYLTDV